jgi:tetratricopeptide (TPR) repeat protein
LPDVLQRVLVLVFILVSVSSLSASPQDNFTAANKAFENKQYPEAISKYSAIIAGGVESAPLYFNLGNAYFKNGDLGRAILYYLKAKRLDPANEDIKANLDFARRFTSIQMEGVQLNPINNFVASLVDPYRLTSLAWISSLFFVLFVSTLILRFGLRIDNGLIRIGAIAALVVLVAASSLTTFKYRNDYLTKQGVIVAEQCPVRTGPTDQSDIELQGAPGLVVDILAESSDYYNVQFENMRRGWVKKDLVAEV